MSDRPLIILGVDGLDWEYVDAHRDELPTLAAWPRLQSLRSVFPPDSIAAWTTIFTGIPPGDHGFLDSIDYLSGRPASAAEAAGETLSGATFWDEAARRGRSVCVINPFLAYPAWDVNGLMISGPVFVSGELSVTGREREELGPIPQLGGVVDFPTPRTMGPFIDETFDTTRQQADFGMRMLELTQPDLFFLNVLTLDRLQHFVWRFADPDDPTYPGPNPHGDALLASYRMIDDIAAQYAERGRVLAHQRPRPRPAPGADGLHRRSPAAGGAAAGDPLRAEAHVAHLPARTREAGGTRAHLPVPLRGAGVSASAAAFRAARRSRNRASRATPTARPHACRGRSGATATAESSWGGTLPTRGGRSWTSYPS